jgi:hypothetical protein
MRYKVYTQEQVREKIAEFLKDCSEEDFMRVTNICFGISHPMFEEERDERGFRKISMFD